MQFSSEELVRFNESVDVLEDGKSSFKVVGCYQGEQMILDAARVSYAAGTKRKRGDDALLHYLLEHFHDSPFEFPVATFRMELPIFVARQIVRHRAASLNEQSGRYSILEDKVYIPAAHRMAAQSTVNKQGSGQVLGDEAASEALDLITTSAKESYAAYERLLELGLARETARGVLSVNQYTAWYWQANLRMILHLLHLRDDPNAQWETRQYAIAMAAFVEAWVPSVFDAWNEYRHRALVVPAGVVPLLRLDAEAIADTRHSDRTKERLRRSVRAW